MQNDTTCDSCVTETNATNRHSRDDPECLNCLLSHQKKEEDVVVVADGKAKTVSFKSFVRQHCKQVDNKSSYLFFIIFCILPIYDYEYDEYYVFDYVTDYQLIIL